MAIGSKVAKVVHPEFTVLFLDLASQLSTAVAPHLPIDFEVGAPSLPMKVINSKINFGILRYPKKDIHISVCGSKLIPKCMPRKICFKYGSLAALSVPTLHFLRHFYANKFHNMGFSDHEKLGKLQPSVSNVLGQCTKKTSWD